MLCENSKVLVLATSRKTRGGVTSVVKAHQKEKVWKKYHIKWIETHRDGNLSIKFYYFIAALLQYIILLPFYDIIHIHLSEPPSAIRKSIFLGYAKLWEKKIIVHFHSFSPNTTIKSKYKKVYKYLFSKADCIIVLSEYWRKIITKEFVLKDKVIILYNPCTTEISAKLYLKKKEILYAGTINARKGYADLIRAFAGIAEKNIDWQLVFAGNGEIEQAKLLAKDLGIEKQTIFLGWVTGEVKDRAFKEASIFCLPSYAEGFPMAVLDAWAYELPVITTPVGGLPDIVKDGVNVLLFESGNIEQLTSQLEKMILDENLRKNIVMESSKLSEIIFNNKNISEQLINIYQSVIDAKKFS
jgi:glycosyltransferase involved in cell wall biosynthesis